MDQADKTKRRIQLVFDLEIAATDNQRAAEVLKMFTEFANTLRSNPKLEGFFKDAKHALSVRDTSSQPKDPPKP